MTTGYQQCSSLYFYSTFFITVFLMMMVALPSRAQFSAEVIAPAEQKDREPIEVMVLGMYHFANPNRDEFNVEAVDVLKPEHQEEIRTVVENLARFRPDKIALERVVEESAKVDSLYQAYRSGKHRLTRSETQQIGFRLAKNMGHPKVYATDYKYAFPMDEVKKFAKDHDPDFLEYLQHWGQSLIKREDSLQKYGGVREALLGINAPYFEDAQRQMYARSVTVGNHEEYPGVELVANWHRRNMRIFTNMEHIAEPGDRIILMYGAGHSAILRDLVSAHPFMKLVDPLEYL